MPGCLSYIVAKDLADATTIWATEVWQIGTHGVPSRYVNRAGGREGIDQAIHGLEKAWVAMAKICHRIEESPKGL